MGTLTTIIIISVIIGVCVVGITIIQRREQEKARVRQLVSKYRFRANETANILENFATTPIGTESRSLMLGYIKLNLKQALKLAPNDLALRNHLDSVNQQTENVVSNVDSQKLNIPRDPNQLNALIQQLAKLSKYLLRFKSVQAIDAKLIAVAVNKLNLLISEAKISAYMQHGQNFLNQNDLVRSQSYFQTAQKMLDQFSNKNPRMQSLESELQALIKLPAKEVVVKPISNETHNDVLENTDDIFGPKKKW